VHHPHTVLIGDGILHGNGTPGIAADPVDPDPHAAGGVRNHYQVRVIRRFSGRFSGWDKREGHRGQ
jgi:hypothetical protein